MNDNVSEIPTPPTKQDLEKLQMKPSKTPKKKKYTRDIHQRIFVNRSVNMENIKYIGFDMDYTLAIYNAPEYESLVYDLVVQKLLRKGYPKEIGNFKYDPSFPIRGLFLDKKLGMLLKVDNFGYILRCVKGRKVIYDIRSLYPDKIVHPEEIGGRFFMIDTLFGLPEACLYADLVQYFEDNKVLISFKSLFEDVRDAVHTAHISTEIKDKVLADLPKFIAQTGEKMATLMLRLQKQGRKVFLLTNSDFDYTSKVMSYLLDGKTGGEGEAKKWTDFFNIIITSASKPKFFESGTTLREVDPTIGALKFTNLADNKFEQGKIYAGGSLSLFQQFTGSYGSEVLYVGDNISHDIVYNKKSRCLWRTLLVVRELEDEINNWIKHIDQWRYLENLEYLRAKTYQNMTSADVLVPQAKDLKHQIRQSIRAWDEQFNKYFGSPFRSGPSESFFSYQVQRFADLYASDYLSLLNYPFFYYFSSLAKLLPHEKQILQFEEDSNNETSATPAEEL